MTALDLSAYRRADVQLPRLLAGVGERSAELRWHERQHGPMPLLRRAGRLIDVVEASGLTGRGGAGFPAGRKMRSVAAGPGSKVLVANGAEGEPASLKDRLLLSRLPHLVLDGMTLAAEAVGASEAYLCVHGRRRTTCWPAWTTRWPSASRPAWTRCRSG